MMSDVPLLKKRECRTCGITNNCQVFIKEKPCEYILDYDDVVGAIKEYKDMLVKRRQLPVKEGFDCGYFAGIDIALKEFVGVFGE